MGSARSEHKRHSRGHLRGRRSLDPTFQASGDRDAVPVLSPESFHLQDFFEVVHQKDGRGTSEKNFEACLSFSTF
jgi:hypothetical protein